jgi:hypothetical protein
LIRETVETWMNFLLAVVGSVGSVDFADFVVDSD